MPFGSVTRCANVKRRTGTALSPSCCRCLQWCPWPIFLVGALARVALRPLDDLRRDIASRGDTRLAPLDARNQPAELAAISASLNGLMIRLAQSLDGERAFASSAAHELRTPVAVALAQVQRLQTATTDPQALAAIKKVEDALRRMARLVTRLLQMARADAGVGLSENTTDIARMLRFVVDEGLRDLRRADRIALSVPDAPVLSHMDADAFAIVAGNLIDNAFEHGDDKDKVTVVLSAAGDLRVSNACDTIKASDLAHLTDRLHRGQSAREGFGLGLYIADRIARQVGSRLELRSPPAGRASGFEAHFAVPKA